MESWLHHVCFTHWDTTIWMFDSIGHSCQDKIRQIQSASHFQRFFQWPNIEIANTRPQNASHRIRRVEPHIHQVKLCEYSFFESGQIARWWRVDDVEWPSQHTEPTTNSAFNQRYARIHYIGTSRWQSNQQVRHNRIHWKEETRPGHTWLQAQGLRNLSDRVDVAKIISIQEEVQRQQRWWKWYTSFTNRNSTGGCFDTLVQTTAEIAFICTDSIWYSYPSKCTLTIITRTARPIEV